MTDPSKRLRLVIMGAAGRDFNNFNVAFREVPAAEVEAFTAAQVPGIARRRYPPSLAGAASIEVGKKADLIVIDKNLFEIPVNEIHRQKY